MKHTVIKNTLLRLTAIMLLFMGTIPATAQYYMNIRQTDGTQLRYAVSSVDSVWFEKDVYEYVDLGLSVKWATFNIGATAPEEYGDYFAWGETEPYYEAGYAQESPQAHWKDGKSVGYYWPSYKYCNGSYNTMTKYCNNSSYGNNGFTDKKTTLEKSDDIARFKWGGSWRMPTKAEFTELLNNCTWTWTTQNGVNGYKVTSKKSGYTDRSIFLPAAGYRYNPGGLNDVGSGGYYTDYPNEAWFLNFLSGGRSTYDYYRYRGLSVRPVCP